jgi:hypothetical protein
MGKMKLVTVSPELATKWLNGHVNFRPISERTISQYIADIAGGRWQENGETIKLDEHGKLVDGQHRLEAIIRSGKSVESWVFEGARKAILRTVDTGKRRTLGDLLHHNGEKYPNALATLLGMVHRHLMGQLRDAASRGAMSHQRGETLLSKFNEARQSIALVHADTRKTLVPRTMLAFVHMMAGRHDDKEMADLWLKEVITGENISAKHPTYELRKWMVNRLATSRPGAKASPVVMLAVTTKSWFYFRDGEKVSVLRWRSDEEFPTFPGYGCEAPKPEPEMAEAKGGQP